MAKQLVLARTVQQLGMFRRLREKREGANQSETCICVHDCDCENPDPPTGVALGSNTCPVHNQIQQPHPECKAHKHWFE